MCTLLCADCVYGLQLCLAVFLGAIAISLLRDLLPTKIGRSTLPLPLCCFLTWHPWMVHLDKPMLQSYQYPIAQSISIQVHKAAALFNTTAYDTDVSQALQGHTYSCRLA